MGSQKLLHWEGSSLAHKYQTRVKVTDSVIRSSFLGLPNNYSCKPFYDTASRALPLCNTICGAKVYFTDWRVSIPGKSNDIRPRLR